MIKKRDPNNIKKAKCEKKCEKELKKNSHKELEKILEQDECKPKPGPSYGSHMIPPRFGKLMIRRQRKKFTPNWTYELANGEYPDKKF